jgi:predicted DNA-binding ribbon-helix-helix protein
MIKKRSIRISGHTTSIGLEDAFWDALKDIAADWDMTLSQVIAAIDARRDHDNLSSAARLFVLETLREKAGEAPSMFILAQEALVSHVA